MGITALVVFSVVGLAIIVGNANWKKYRFIKGEYYEKNFINNIYFYFYY